MHVKVGESVHFRFHAAVALAKPGDDTTRADPDQGVLDLPVAVIRGRHLFLKLDAAPGRRLRPRPVGRATKKQEKGTSGL